jgi:5-methylthioadenosine/S-adenosylhomocysteine deaminase
MATTVIKNADWIISWNEKESANRYIRQADVVFRDNLITFVGKDYRGKIDETIPGEGLCVMPGLVNIHSHPSTEVMNKGFDGDGIGGQLGEFAWINYLYAYSPAMEDRVICAELGLCELLLSGVTTLVDISSPYPGWFELGERSGLRLYFAPMYTSTADFWSMNNLYQVSYHWADDQGKSRMDEALRIIDRALSDSSGQLSGVVMPAQVDTCTPELLHSSLAAAKERGIPLQIHAGQLICEFQEIVRRHGLTPIKFLDQQGLLVPETIVSHAIMLDHYRTTNFLGTSNDLSILAKSGASIAHCPLIFARIGDALDNFGRYLKEGVNIGIGTDTYPHNMIEEMRTALLISRVVSGKLDNVSTAEIFSAATIGGANALHRQDIGRIAPGAKADIVLLDLSVPSMQPMRDPIRSLVHHAADRAVKDVIIDGVKVVEDRRILSMDYLGTNQKIEQVRQRMEAALPQHDFAGRTIEDLSPLVFPVEELDD